MKWFKKLGVGLVISLITSMAALADEGVTTLDVTADFVKRDEVRHSMVGPRNTLIFYSFANHHSVLVIRVENKTAEFPMTAKLHVFKDNVTAEGLEKWVNNQHSDGIYPKVPEPVNTYEIPKESFKVISKKMTGTTKSPMGDALFEDYEVQFKMADVEEAGVFKLKGCTETTRVFLKVN